MMWEMPVTIEYKEGEETNTVLSDEQSIKKAAAELFVSAAFLLYWPALYEITL